MIGRQVALAIIAVSAISLPSFESARGDTIRPCLLPTGATEVPYETDTPPILRTLMTETLGDIVPAGAPFDATDVVMTGRIRRIIFAWNRGHRWVIVTEHGGRAYNDPVFAYDVAPDGSTATMIAQQVAFPTTVCSTALALLTLPPQQSGH